MYEVNIPVMLKYRNEKAWEKTISELKKVNPDYVFLVYLRTLVDKKEKDNAIALFKNNKEILETAGFKVVAWFAPTIGYGALSSDDNQAEKYYRKIMSVHKKEPYAYCPLDENFRKDLCDEFKRVAKTGVTQILLEDDFTLTGGKDSLDNLSCLCEEHLRILRERIGEEITREELFHYLTEGKPNLYRTEYLKLMRETLLLIASDIEKAVHSVSPDIRIGYSSNSASYHIEGVSAFEIAKTLAGKNKPFVRLTGAPYWKNGDTLNATIETARMQGVWFSEHGMDVMTEGDTYPRPRFLVSAGELEMYDTILRADGSTGGILKYMLDYTSVADYETGYVDFHNENRELYEEIEKRFKGKNVGLKILEYPHDIGSMDFDEIYDYNGFTDHGVLPLLSQWFITDNSIPTTYGESDGAALVFGTNAHFVTEKELNKGLILDAKAAKILSEKGIDVGFEKIEKAPRPTGEIFLVQEDYTVSDTGRGLGFFKFTLKEEAKVLSRFFLSSQTLSVVTDCLEDTESYPACYTYQNKAGQRFMVYTFSPNQVKIKSEWHNGIFRNFYRQKQLIDGYEWLSSKPLPAVSEKNPFIYILCKRDANKLNVGLWNLSKDKINNPIIRLDKEYSEIDVFRCKGEILGTNVKIEKVLYPYECIFFTVTEK